MHHRLAITSLLLAMPVLLYPFAIQDTTGDGSYEDSPQTTITTEVSENTIINNLSAWSVGMGIGVNVTMGDNDHRMRFTDMLAPAVDLNITRWFNPSFGLALSYNGYKIKGICNGSWTGQNFRIDKIYSSPRVPHSRTEADDTYYEQRANFMNLHLDCMADLTNMIYGYNRTRLYRLMPYVGLGWIHSYGHQGKRGNELSINCGVINKFRINDVLDLNLTLRVSIFDDDFDGEVTGKMADANGVIQYTNEQNIDFDGMIALTVGLSYRFGESAKTGSTTTTTTRVTINRRQLNDQVSDMRKTQPAEQIQEAMPIRQNGFHVIPEIPYKVRFETDQIYLNTTERANLAVVAEIIKSNPSRKYTIYGPQSSQERDQWLTDYRVKTIYKILTGEYDVPPQQLVEENKSAQIKTLPANTLVIDEYE